MTATIDDLRQMLEADSPGVTHDGSNGSFTFTAYDEPITCFAHPSAPSEVYLRAEVAELDGMSAPGRFCEAALAGNLFWRATAGATLSVDVDAGRVYLTDRRDASDLAGLEVLDDFLRTFCETVGAWRDRAALYREEGAETADETSEPEV